MRVPKYRSRIVIPRWFAKECFGCNRMFIKEAMLSVRRTKLFSFECVYCKRCCAFMEWRPVINVGLGSHFLQLSYAWCEALTFEDPMRILCPG